MQKNFLIFFMIVLFIITTTLVVIFKPKTHKQIAFENRDFKLELISQSAQVNIPKTETNVQIAAPEINIETPEVKINVETPKINVNSSASVQIQKTSQNKTTQKPVTSKQVNNISKNTQKTNVTNNQNSTSSKKTENKTLQTKTDNKKTEMIKTVTLPVQTTTDTKTVKKEQQEQKQVQNIVKTQEPVKVKKQLTQEELEIIAWNKWRSDLQNQLMRDSKMAAPIGTRFMFSFTVDKFGTITNLKTWSNNPSYTPMAVRVIKPILLSYQGKPILNFPTNSKRITTNVDGGFTMAYSSNYSKPSDYNDYERIKK